MITDCRLGLKPTPADIDAIPFSRVHGAHQKALERCIDRLRALLPVIGLRNPKIGRPDNTWNYCGPFDWVVGFHAGQLWLAYQLTGDPAFANSARARRPVFRHILDTRVSHEHDLGFQFSLTSVAEWLQTGDAKAREMGLEAARILVSRFHPEGNYIQAWNAHSAETPERSAFALGRIIADCMMNMGLLHWAHRETGRADFRDIAVAQAETTVKTIIRPDCTSFHCFSFDTRTGEPVGGSTHQGFSDASCWARGQAWLIHGFAQSYRHTGRREWLELAEKLAAKMEELLEGRDLMPWDFHPDAPDFTDSSATAITASGAYMLANLRAGDEAARWRAFGDRLIDGLLKHCDLTGDPGAQGMLSRGASHVPNGLNNAMLPYGDYFFMEALMRSQGHDSFFW